MFKKAVTEETLTEAHLAELKDWLQSGIDACYVMNSPTHPARRLATAKVIATYNMIHDYLSMLQGFKTDELKPKRKKS